MKKKTYKKHNELLERELTSLEKSLMNALHARLGQIQSGQSSWSSEFMDKVSNSELNELAARIAESDSTKIDEIENALRRLREGNYGICRDCGKSISKKRLKARPFATLCIICKTNAEKAASERGSRKRGQISYPPSDLYDSENSDTELDFHDSIRGDKF